MGSVKTIKKKTMNNTNTHKVTLTFEATYEDEVAADITFRRLTNTLTEIGATKGTTDISEHGIAFCSIYGKGEIKVEKENQ